MVRLGSMQLGLLAAFLLVIVFGVPGLLRLVFFEHLLIHVARAGSVVPLIVRVLVDAASVAQIQSAWMALMDRFLAALHY